MKTIKILLSIAGFALSITCFGQDISQNENEVLYYTAYHNPASKRIEHQLTALHERNSSGDHFEAPLASKTFFTPIEFDMTVEEWMTRPFESSYFEDELQLESWMSLPFESKYHEDELKVESWMTGPWN